MKHLSLLLYCFIYSITAAAFSAGQYKETVAPTKNVILMIPDGTSLSVVSAARWYQFYHDRTQTKLSIDPYLCGTVQTYCSNAPIGDSAPTTSCYMTGVPARTGNVSIYPAVDEKNDLIPFEAEKAYQPLITILEAAKYSLNKSTGLVVTCEFPHATPADCSAHHYKRSNYACIAPQMAYNNLDVMFGGGCKILTDDIRDYFNKTGTTLLENNINAFRSYNTPEKIWALFHNASIPYDMDRDDKITPSLAEMTKKAIELLSKNENGFFLMVEGSKVDFAAHDHDVAACITEFLAFDKAVKEAMDFAKKEGNTTVVVLPDHGTGGFTIGSARSNSGYANKSISELFSDISKVKASADVIAEKIATTPPVTLKEVVLQYTGISMTEKEMEQLISSSNYKMGSKSSSKSPSIKKNITTLINSRTYFGFTTTGHTGEDVFLAAYHPKGHTPKGMNTNIEINQYLFDACGLPTPLPVLTEELFAKHTDVFSGMDISIDKEHKNFPILIVKHNGKTLKIPAFKSVISLDENEKALKSVVVYFDKTDTFYLPKTLRSLF